MRKLLRLSEFMIGNPQVTSFQDLLVVLGDNKTHGATLLEMDLKPDYPDTPRNWETLVESAFTWGVD
ncbi:MAG: sulfur relay protein DsrC [Alphaproteobacteria bacterium]|nr:sulfur relay protein DsrC [Alphaproteobacteria bacterium]